MANRKSNLRYGEGHRRIMDKQVKKATVTDLNQYKTKKFRDKVIADLLRTRVAVPDKPKPVG